MITITLRRLIILTTAIVAWCVWFSIDREYDRERTLENGFRVRELIHVYRRPYMPLGPDGQGAFPIPSTYEEIQRQTLLLGDNTLWQGPLLVQNETMHLAEFKFAPNGKKILITGKLNNFSWKIVDVDSGRIVEVPSPGRAVYGHYYGYPFVFRNWDNNSEYVFATITGSDLSLKHMIQFSSLWRIRASDGSYDQIERTEEQL